MTVLSQSQMMMYASAAGLPNPALWAAIGMAESSGRTDVINGIGCVGVWQINAPDWRPQYPQWTDSWLQDPMHNAQAARVVFDAQGLGAWEGYTSGSYRQYLASGASTTATPADDVRGSPFSAAPQPPMNSGSGWGGIFALPGQLVAGAEWVSNPHNWLRVAYVAIGGLVVLVGIGGILRPVLQPVASGATKVATKVTPVGRAATVAGKAAKAAGKGAK